MSDLRKQHLLDTLFKINGSENEIQIQIAICFQVLKNRYDIDRIKLADLHRKHESKLYERIKAAYSKEFSESEINQMIDFWSSSVGRKVTSSKIIDEMKSIGMSWAKEVEESVRSIDTNRENG